MTRELESRRKIWQTPNIENAQPELKKLLWMFPPGTFPAFPFLPPCLQHLAKSCFSPSSWNPCLYLSRATLSPMCIQCLLLALATLWQKCAAAEAKATSYPDDTNLFQVPALPFLPLRVQADTFFSCISFSYCPLLIPDFMPFSHLPFAFCLFHLNLRIWSCLED